MFAVQKAWKAFRKRGLIRSDNTESCACSEEHLNGSGGWKGLCPESNSAPVKMEKQADHFLLHLDMWQKINIFGPVHLGYLILYPRSFIQDQPLKHLTHTSFTQSLVSKEIQVVLHMSLYLFMISWHPLHNKTPTISIPILALNMSFRSLKVRPFLVRDPGIARLSL